MKGIMPHVNKRHHCMAATHARRLFVATCMATIIFRFCVCFVVLVLPSETYFGLWRKAGAATAGCAGYGDQHTSPAPVLLPMRSGAGRAKARTAPC